MSTAYTDAAPVRLIASELVPTHHRDLISFGARIEFVWRDKASKKGGKTVLGKARRVSGLNAYLAREDQGIEGEDVPDFFVIEIAEDVWPALTPRQQTALVDHELSHCAIDHETGKLVMRPHDCEEFCAVVERHGLWRQDVQEFVNAAKGVQLDLIPGGRHGDVRDRPEAQVAALVELLRRAGAKSEDAFAMGLLDRRIAAAAAGLEDVADSMWVTVVHALRATERAGEEAS